MIIKLQIYKRNSATSTLLHHNLLVHIIRKRKHKLRKTEGCYPGVSILLVMRICKIVMDVEHIFQKLAALVSDQYQGIMSLIKFTVQIY